MLTRRIIPCLDVRDGKVVKGVRFKDHVVVGAIEELAVRYRDEGADELVFYDISASPQGRIVDYLWIERVARQLDIPFCVAGGIRSVESARRILFSGADKISINSPAIEYPQLIDELAAEFGVQCVVVGIDSQPSAGKWYVHQYTGDPERSRMAATTTIDWVHEAVRRGAGEIVLNCMNFDGVKNGYDIEQLSAIRAICPVPLIASGGAGNMQHFLDVFEQADVDGALAASVFHENELRIPELKSFLHQHGIEVRP